MVTSLASKATAKDTCIAIDNKLARYCETSVDRKHKLGPTRIATLTTIAACFFALLGCGNNGNPFTPSPSPSPAPAPAPPPAQAELQTWTNSFGTTPFTMVGTDPMKGSATTNIPVVVIPIAFNFGDGVILSPDVGACGDSESVTQRVMESPVITNVAWEDEGTPIGTTQFGDAFQRANFWQIISTQAPDYHVMLYPVNLAPTQTYPPPADATLSENPVCLTPVANISTADMNFIVQQAISALQIPPDTLAVFLTYNIEFPDYGSGSLYFGYHYVLGQNTFIVASYTDPNFSILTLVSSSDTAILSHEIGEWMDDPYGTNLVPAWGNFGIQQSCGTTLEVGDPLTGYTYPVTAASGFTYHVQELAYFSWFARNSPSYAVHGKYSVQGTFITYAPPCY